MPTQINMLCFTIFLGFLTPLNLICQVTSQLTGTNGEELLVTIGSDTLIKPDGASMVWKPSSFLLPVGPLKPSISLVSYNDGFDLVYDYQNGPDTVRNMGQYFMGKVQLDTIVYEQDFWVDGHTDTLNMLNGHGIENRDFYPPSRYSPCLVVSDDQYIIGVSILYPVMDWQHAVGTSLTSPTGSYWQIEMNNNSSLKNQGRYYQPDGNLDPNEQRQYRVAVRIFEKGNSCRHWLETLQPYRDHFHAHHTHQRYTVDRRPVVGLMLAGRASLDSATNPYGFRAPTRVDTLGYKVVKDTLLNLVPKGWARSMIWSPTGFYLNNDSLNYPFRFTSHWLEGDTLLYPSSYGHKMGDAIDTLSSISSSEMETGLWWGRPGQVSYAWDTSAWDSMDINNALHLQIAYKELDGAFAAGTETIGLDAFTHSMDPWTAYAWLQMMHRRYPEIKFVREQGNADFFHLFGGQFYYSERIISPQYLAHYLMPDHESWAMWRKNHSPDSIWTSEFSRVTQMGYVGMAEISEALPQPFHALPSSAILPALSLGPDIVSCTCQNDPVVLDAGYADAVSFLWDDNSTSQTRSVTSSGTYWVRTFDSNGCVQSDTINVTILPPAVPQIVSNSQASPNSVHNFSGTGTGVVSWRWEFGDGNSAFTQNPSHTYDSMGVYQVLLITYNSACVDTAYQTLIVDTTSTNVVSPGSPFGNWGTYPNPAQEKIYIWGKDQQMGQGKLELFNLMGAKLDEWEVPAGESEFLFQYDTREVPSGVYILIYRSGKIVDHRKVLIRK